jgi:hypothetical protein
LEEAMSKRPTDREKLLFKLNRLTDSEIREVLNYISRFETMKRSLPLLEASDDDLVALLSAAYENCRARQVFEWESARRKAEARASTQRDARR